MRRSRLVRVGIAALAGALLVSGCARGGEVDPEEPNGDGGGQQEQSLYTEGMVGPQPEGDPQSGGTLVWSAFLEPRSLDPAVTLATASTGGVEMINIYDTLTRYDAEEGATVPQLAESVEANDDYTEFTVNLRPGLTFSDGSPFDADAVKWSMDRYAASPTAPDGRIWNSSVESVNVVDETTVQIVLTERYPGFPNLLSSGPGMIVAESSVAGGEDSFEPIGAGPFVLAEFRTGEAVVLEANPDYWDGEPYLDTLRVSYLNNQQAAMDAMRNGDVQAALLRDADKVDEMLEGGHSAYVNMVAASNSAIFNSGSEPGGDLRVRKAMAMAIDPEVIHERAYNGKGIPTLRLFPEYSKWYDESTPQIEYNPEEAQRLLEEAKADGYSGKLVFSDGQDEGSRATALVVKGQLEAIGFEVETNLLRTAAEQITAAIQGDYEALGWGVSIREFDPYAKISTAMHSEGTQLYNMPTSEKMDGLIAELKAADAEEAKEVMKQIETEYVEYIPFISWAPFAEATVWNDNVYGVIGASNSMVLFSKAFIN